MTCAETGKEINPDSGYITYEDKGETWYFIDTVAYHAWIDRLPKPKKKK